MSDHRWQGYTHPELFAQIHEGPGADASTDSVRRWGELNRALGDLDADLSAALTSAMAGWEGDAADSARNGLRPLGDWARDAQQATEIMRDRAEQQASFIGRARSDMPDPVSVSAEDPGAVGSMLVHLFGGQTDYEQQEAAQDAAEQQAFQVMRTYENSTSSNTTTLASFTPPPQLTVDVPSVASSGHSGIHQQPITISWGAVPGTGGTPGGPGVNGRTGTFQSRGTNQTGRGGNTGQPTTGSREAPARSSSTATRRAPASTEDDAEIVREPVTEQHTGEGLFDVPCTSARPVIGGDPG